MWLIGLCAMVGLALVLWKLVELSRTSARNARVIAAVDGQLAAGRIAEALALARQTDAAAARVLATGLARRGAPLDRVLRATEIAAGIEIAQASRGVAALSALATATPVLGFLLAAVRLLTALDAARGGTTLDPARMGELVGAALVVAAAGIVAAIPMRVMAAYFTSRVRALALEMYRATLRMLDALGAAEAPTGPAPR